MKTQKSGQMQTSTRFRWSIGFLVCLSFPNTQAFVPQATICTNDRTVQGRVQLKLPANVSSKRDATSTKIRMVNKNHSRQRRSNVVVRVLRKFAQSFLKGLALPFPILQTIAFSVRPHNQEGRPSAFSISISLKEGLLALFLYLTTGVIAYTKILENWSIIDALYFSSVCFSTVGYGDMIPTTPASRVFTCLFGMCGIAFLGAAVAAIGGKVVEAEVTAARTARKISRKRIMDLFDVHEGMPQVLQPFRKVQSKVLLKQAMKARKDFQEKIEKDRLLRIQHIETSLWRILKRLATKSLSSLSIIFFGGLVMRHLNAAATSWTIPQSIYFSLVTGAFHEFVSK